MDENNKKSYAKGMGLKSTLVSGSDIYMTTFGKGSDARLEKRIDGNNIICLNNENEKEAFSAEFAEKNTGYKIGNAKFNHPKGYAVVANNPLYSGEIADDMLGLKETLEKRYFGDSVRDINNICIQIIHNILDIEKILAQYITNAAYAVDNISGLEKDVIGFGEFSSFNTYDEFIDPDKHSAHYGNDAKKIEKIKEEYKNFDNLLDNDRIKYLGKAFFVKENDEYFIKNDNECYHIIALLSSLRNWVVHNNENDDRISRTWLYQLESKLDKEFIQTLNYMYDDMADELTKNFSKNSAANVNYIAETLDISPQIFAEQYFRFSIMKEQKNIGFTLTKLREIMLDTPDFRDIRDNHRVFDSIRPKLYTMMDYVIYRHYTEQAEKVEKENAGLPPEKHKLSEKDKFVIELRGSFSESDKEKLYAKEAERILRILEPKMKKIKAFRGEMTKKYKENIAPKLRRILPYGKDITAFSKLMYMLTMFLDGKEINDLLTTLINKFDNIQCFLKIMPLINVNAEFTDEYSFFNGSGKIADELRIIKSFARMGEPVANAKRIMMIDAIQILGTDLTYSDIKAIADRFFFDANGNKLKKGKHGMRNFIINNVISNKRFHYLIRYGKPEKLHKIAQNEAVVKYVLHRIADIQKRQGEDGKNQIDRYYEVCVGKKDNISRNEKIDALTKIIVGMNYDQFEKKRDVLENSKNNVEREKYKKIISLYLTVIYHILKNLVNINSRYVLGFHCVERDAQLYVEKGYNIKLEKLEKNGFSSVTMECLGVPENDPIEYKKLYPQLEAKAKASIAALETENPALYAKYSAYSDGQKKAELEKQINREKAKTAKNKHLQNTKWNVIIRRNSADKDNGVLRTFRNQAAHLEIARNIDAYFGEITEVKSYFQIYHYLMQRTVMDKMQKNVNAKFKAYFDSVKADRKYSDRLLKDMCIPFGYCIPRYKNLSIEALFDMNENTESAAK